MTYPAVERVTIFDTTLRDGKQAPSFSMDGHAKVAMAHALADLGVDVIKAGFAAASPGDEEAIRRVGGEVEGPIICSLARATEHDIAAAARSIKPATKARIHIQADAVQLGVVAMIAASAMFLVDTYYVALEMRFRNFYDEVEVRDLNQAADLKITPPANLGDIKKVVVSKSSWLFYGPVLLACITFI